MNVRVPVLVATLVLAVACSAPLAVPAPAPPPAGLPPPHPAASSQCARAWDGRDAAPPEFVTCDTADDCTGAYSAGCCHGTVAVNKAHAVCMQANDSPCEME